MCNKILLAILCAIGSLPGLQIISFLEVNKQPFYKKDVITEQQIVVSDDSDHYVYILFNTLQEEIRNKGLLNKRILYPFLVVSAGQQYYSEHTNKHVYQTNNIISTRNSFIYKNLPQKKPEDSCITGLFILG